MVELERFKGLPCTSTTNRLALNLFQESGVPYNPNPNPLLFVLINPRLTRSESRSTTARLFRMCRWLPAIHSPCPQSRRRGLAQAPSLPAPLPPVAPPAPPLDTEWDTTTTWMGDVILPSFHILRTRCNITASGRGNGRIVARANEGLELQLFAPNAMWQRNCIHALQPPILSTWHSCGSGSQTPFPAPIVVKRGEYDSCLL